MTLQAVNPANGKKIRSYPEMRHKQIHQAVEQSYHAFLHWRKSDLAQRSQKMKEIARIFSREFLQESPIIAFFIFLFVVIFLMSILSALLT